MKRDWTAARGKVASEGSCRRCGTRQWIEAAHIVPRSLGGGQSASAIVPLCRDCHRLDLIPFLSLDEQLEAVRVLGLERAYRRLRGTA